MPQPPELAAESRRLGAERSLELRRKRASVKHQISSRELALGFAWQLPDAQGMKVYALLTALPGIGGRKATLLMEAAGIPPTNTVRSCGSKQRTRLFELLSMTRVASQE